MRSLKTLLLSDALSRDTAFSLFITFKELWWLSVKSFSKTEKLWFSPFQANSSMLLKPGHMGENIMSSLVRCQVEQFWVGTSLEELFRKLLRTQWPGHWPLVPRGTTWVQLLVGSPPTEEAWMYQVQCGPVKVKGVKVPGLGVLEFCREVKRCWQDIVADWSQILEKGWTLQFSAVACGEWWWAGLVVLTGKQVRHH